MRVAVIGAGISGIAAAHVLQKNGHEAIVFEKSSEIGGVWAHAYPEVSLQNTGLQYRLSDSPWPLLPVCIPLAHRA
jgi:cation diffusion facilitator CzcD-associated flavoprotein CzcO